MKSLRGMPASRTAMIHDLLLELANLRHVRAQVENQRIRHARRQAQLHELVRQ